MEGRVWAATRAPNVLAAIDADDPSRVATSLSTDGGVNLGAADRDWLWTAGFDTGRLERRSLDDGAVTRSVFAIERPTGMVLDIDDVWLSPQHFTKPVTRVAKHSMAVTATRPHDERVVAATADAIWLGTHVGFDNSTLIGVDRATGQRRVYVSGDNASPYLFVGDAIWVAGYPQGGITVFDALGAVRSVVDAPLVSQMQATNAGVFILSASSPRVLERRSWNGEIQESIAAPDAHAMAADGRGVWLAVVHDREVSEVEIITRESYSFEELGSVTLPGRFPRLFPADFNTATSTH
jgi:hypothetical protein